MTTKRPIPIADIVIAVTSRHPINPIPHNSVTIERGGERTRKLPHTYNDVSPASLVRVFCAQMELLRRNAVEVGRYNWAHSDDLV